MLLWGTVGAPMYLFVALFFLLLVVALYVLACDNALVGCCSMVIASAHWSVEL